MCFQLRQCGDLDTFLLQHCHLNHLNGPLTSFGVLLNGSVAFWFSKMAMLYNVFIAEPPHPGYLHRWTGHSLLYGML